MPPPSHHLPTSNLLAVENALSRYWDSTVTVEAVTERQISLMQFISKNFTPPGGYTSMRLARRVTPQEVRKQKLDMMPGFKLTWHYSGMEVEPEAKYSNQSDTLAFVRNEFKIFI